MDVQTAANSPLYLFEKFEVGIIHLDAERTVLAMNDFARKVLPVGHKQPFDKLVTSFHPERSKPKVNFLLDQASACPVANSTPMTMIINIPEQVLLIKVTRLGDHLGKTTGFVLVFYEVTQVVSQPAPESAKPATNLRLNRIPLVANNKVAFVETQDVLCLESQSHYTRVLTRDGFHFCPRHPRGGRLFSQWPGARQRQVRVQAGLAQGLAQLAAHRIGHVPQSGADGRLQHHR
jgi:hypothetical protein